MFKTCSCSFVWYFRTLFWDDVIIIWDENIVYEKKNLLMTNKKFFLLNFLATNYRDHPKITYENIVQKDMKKFHFKASSRILAGLAIEILKGGRGTRYILMKWHISSWLFTT